MIQDQPQPPPLNKQTHWPSILVLINAVAGLIFFFGIASTAFLSGFINLFSRESGPNELSVIFSYTAAGLLLGMLLLPSIVLAINRISGRHLISSNFLVKLFSLLHPKRLIWLFPLVVLAGNWLNNLQSINWLLMPVFNLLALGLPIAWLIWAGSKRFSPGSPQRNWSVFSIGITATPLLILILELLFMVAGFFVIAFLLSTVFTGIDLNIDTLLSAITESTNSQQIPEQVIVEFIRQPALLLIILIFVSGLVPLIEELIKPVAILLLWRKSLTPQDGWLLGLLSGAGFALIESLGNTTVGEDWTFLVLARAGASALHIFNTAIISYTLVLAREKKRFLPALLALLGAILIHALWNGITIFATLSSLENSTDASGAWPIGFIITLAAISLSLIGGILMVNQHLFTKSVQPPAGTASGSNSPEPKPPGTYEREQ
jgi:hypothetical protein